MITNPVPYLITKASGIEWLGDVPENWGVRRLKDVGTLVAGSGFPPHYQGATDECLPYYKVGDLVASSDGRIMDVAPNTVSYDVARRIRARVIPENSVVYAKIGAALLLNRRRITSKPCCIDNNMTAYLPNHAILTTDWAHYWLATIDFAQFVNPGAVPSISEGDQGMLPVLVPPLRDQVAIVRFLGHIEEHIRRYLRTKEKLVELLQEHKSAIIDHAVTHGCNATVSLRPSGFSEIGDIPKHWDLRPIKHWVTINAYVLPESTEADYVFSYVDIGAVGTGSLVEKPQRMYFSEAPSRARRLVHIGDTLVSTVRTYLKAVYFVGDEADQDRIVCSTGFAVLTPRVGTVPKFVSYLFQSNALMNRIMADSVGTAYPAIAERRLGSLHVAVPTHSEQVAIVSFLDRKVSEVDRMISAIRNEISLLREYRTSLIADVVTGKIDVRETASRLAVESNDWNNRDTVIDLRMEHVDKADSDPTA